MSFPVGRVIRDGTDAGRVVHLELHTGDPPARRSSTAELCGWRPDRSARRTAPTCALELGGPLGGGIVECPTDRPLWLPYVEVDQIGEATDRARVLGAQVLLEPREGPAGWRSVVATPAAGESRSGSPSASGPLQAAGAWTTIRLWPSGSRNQNIGGTGRPSATPRRRRRRQLTAARVGGVDVVCASG